MDIMHLEPPLEAWKINVINAESHCAVQQL